MQFSTNLKILRSEKNLSANDLSSILSCSQSLIYEWEKGRSQPSLEMLIKISQFFDVSVDYLIGLSDDIDTATITSEIFTTEEQKLMIKYRTLDIKKQNIIKAMIDVL